MRPGDMNEKSGESNDGEHYLVDVAELNAALRDIGELHRQLDQLRAVKDGAYAERNKLVALVSALFPASLERHDGADWEDDWRWIVFIDLPTGQVSWHIHDSELPMFGHLPRNTGRRWDGHDNDEKWRRVLATAGGFACGDLRHG